MAVRIRMRLGGRPLLLLVADLLILIGAAGVLVFAWSFLDGASYQHTQKVEFATEVANLEVAGGSTGMAKRISLPGTRLQPEAAFQLLPKVPRSPARDPLLIGELDVPRLGLSVIVREGMDAATLRRAVGHVPWTALPGQPGNFVILGHRDTFFRPLRQLEKGDAVRIVTTQGSFTYAVESIEVVGPESVTLSAPPSEAVATLITCFPFNYVGTAPRRFVARARLREGL